MTPQSTECSLDELDAKICKLARQLNAETYRWLALVREFDDRMGWAKWGCRNCAEWLALRCQMSLSAAREKVRTAQALRLLPKISAAFADGRLSYSKVRAVTRVAERHNEEKLLRYALEVSAAQLEERCREMRNGGPEAVEGARTAWERRSLTLRRDAARGTMSIVVELPLADGEVIAQALERAVERREAASEHEFGTASTRPMRAYPEPRSMPGNGWLAQQADALVAVARAYVAGGTEGAGAGSVADHYQVVVHVDESALRGEAGRADLPVETVKRLCCDGSLITIVEDERGNPLDVGRKRRTVTTALKRALWSRDRGCAFPSCHRRRVDAHHLRHWAQGGKTSLENLALLCHYHHVLVHEGGFKMWRDECGELRFQRPDGRMIPRGGYRHEDLDVGLVAEGWAAEATSNASTEGRAAEATSDASAEVRETRAVYASRRRLRDEPSALSPATAPAGRPPPPADSALACSSRRAGTAPPSYSRPRRARQSSRPCASPRP